MRGSAFSHKFITDSNPCNEILDLAEARIEFCLATLGPADLFTHHCSLVELAMPGPCQRGFLQRPIESEGGSEAHWLDAFLSNHKV